MGSKLRIAVVANANSIHTIRWVKWLRKKKHEVTVFSLNDGEDCVYFGPEPALDRSLIFNLGKNVRKTTSELQAKIDEFKPDLVHGFFLVNHGMYASRIKGYPKVVTALGSDVLIAPNESKLMSWIVKKTVKDSDLIISVADHLNSVVSPWKKNHVESISSPLGIDVKKFKPLKKENLIIFNRGFKKVYSPLTLVEAISEISDEIKDYKVIMCGEGPLLEACKNYVNKQSLNDLISFSGFIPNEDLVDLLGRAKILVSPALSDGTPVSILEGLASGCIILSSQIPANKFWTVENKTGLSFDAKNSLQLSDCILKAVNDKSIEQNALIHGPEMVEKYADWNTEMLRIEEKYYNLVKIAK